MKHKLKITLILLAMFIVTQLIGLYVVGHYLQEDNVLPFGLEPPKIEKPSEYYGFFSAIVIAFIIAIFLFLLLTKFKIEFILRLWFFVVVAIALSISFLSVLSPLSYAVIISLVLALPLAFVKIYKKNFLVHNITELFVYPGIATVFVPLLNIWTIIALLVLISAYDIWAVWHSGVMLKMAKYQIDKLNIFAGFFVPYVSKKTKQKIKTWKKTLKKSDLKKKKVKVNVAILGGGDIVFPIIAAGVMMKTLGLASAFLVLAGASLGLAYLFFFAKKKKYYPAMPSVTAGILLGIGLSYLVL